MRFGICCPARPDAWEDAVAAEELGFSDIWFYDSPMCYSDIYVCMALAAEHTRTIRLCTGVAIPGNRITPVTAHSIATINQLAPGRVILGLSTGFRCFFPDLFIFWLQSCLGFCYLCLDLLEFSIKSTYSCQE